MLEPFSGGLVNARDPALLEAGELQACDDCMYRPSDPALHKAYGRTKYNSTALSVPRGLRYLGFDSGGDRLVALDGTTLKTATGTDLGEFTALASDVGSQLDSAAYRNKHYLFTGSTNQVVLSDGTVRRQGLAAMTAPPGATTTTTGGVFPTKEFDTLPAYYEYWVTEVYKTSTEEIESTFSGTPQTVLIGADTYYATITKPATVNTSATHWRVYRSERKQYSSDIAFPAGWRIAELPITETTFSDGLTTPISLTLPTAVESTIPATMTSWPSSLLGTYSAWTTGTPTNVLLADAAVATSPTSSNASEHFVLPIKTFGFTNVGAPISNFTCEIKARKTAGGANLQFAVSWDAGLTISTFWTVPITTVLTAYTITMGTGSELRVESAVVRGDTIYKINSIPHVWTASETSNTNLRFYLIASSTGAAVEVDYVKLALDHSGTTASLTFPFPFTEIDVEDITFQMGSNGAPPQSTTGDVFDGSLVVNDISTPHIIRYSLADAPEYFPAEYLIAFDTKEHDRVRCIRAFGNQLLVGTYNNVFNVNYLPRAEDPTFARGRVKDTIIGSHGIVSSKGACTFVLPGQGLMLAHISRYGPMITDGGSATTLTDDLDWEGTIGNLALLDTCELVNDAKNYQLVLTYGNHRLYFSYHPIHLKNGKLKVSGPGSVGAVAQAHALLADGSERLYSLNADGHVYVENEGNVDASGVGIAPRVRTREIYPEGFDHDAKMTKLLVHHDSPGAIPATVTATCTRTNTDSFVAAPKSLTVGGRRLSRVPLQLECQGVDFEFNFEDSTEPLALNFWILNDVDQGAEGAR